jgi:2-keto-4-pentenoate hydratase
MTTDRNALARSMLADFDASKPGCALAEPIDLSIAEAYALQAEIGRLREARGEHLIGYKVGCTSRAVQAQVGVSEPIFGRLFDSGCHPVGARLSAATFANLAVEGEFAVQLACDVSGEDVSFDQCRAAIAAVFPVIELHHYVIPRTCPPAPWMVASSGLHAGVVMPSGGISGPQHLCGAWSLSVRIDDAVVGSVDDEESLARPVTSLQWLARRMAEFGLSLRQGQLILTGSSLPLYPVSSGSSIVVEAPPLGASSVEIGS